METKRYSSYQEIERDLEILKLEKEIQYQKLVHSFQKTKESITPHNIVSGFLGSYKTLFAGSYGTILNVALPILIKWISKRKGG